MSESYNFTESERAYLSRAEQYCATSEQCCSTVRDKLVTWGASRELTGHIVDRLVADGFIDEERYCRLYCDSKLRLQKWGRVKIAYQLRGKQINNKLIESSIQHIDPELYNSTLRQLAENKMKTINDSDPRKRQSKLMSFLASHGFTPTEIHNIITELNSNDPTE